MIGVPASVTRQRESFVALSPDLLIPPRFVKRVCPARGRTALPSGAWKARPPQGGGCQRGGVKGAEGLAPDRLGLRPARASDS
jgi:hypothetical protein